MADATRLRDAVLPSRPRDAIAARVAVRSMHALDRLAPPVIDDADKTGIRAEVAGVDDVDIRASGEVVDLAPCALDELAGGEEPEEQGDAPMTETLHAIEHIGDRRPSDASEADLDVRRTRPLRKEAARSARLGVGVGIRRPACDQHQG